MLRKIYLAVLVFVVVVVVSGMAALAAPVQGAAALVTATVTPTVTQSSGAGAPVFDAWCMPKGTVVTYAQLEQTTKPASARLLQKTKDGTPELITQNTGCIFSFTFKQSAPEGLKLEVYDVTNVRWLTQPLKLDSGAKMAYATVTHTYIVDPPLWSVAYTLKLVDATGNLLWSSPLALRRGYEPEKCWDGSWPDVTNFTCYYPPDAHPWDAWYAVIPPKP